MSLFGRFRERSDTTFQQVWGSDRDAPASPLNFAPVTRTKALGLSAVYSCVSLIADTVATLPVHAMSREGQRRIELEPQPEWIDRPIPRDPSVTKEVHLGQVITAMLLDGNNFTLAAPNVFDPSEIRVLDPRTVEITRKRDSSINYHVQGYGGEPPADFDWTAIVHIPLIRLPGELRGLSPLEAERLTFQGALSAEELARRFLTSGTWLSAMVESPQGTSFTEAEAKALIASIESKWGGSRNAGRVGILTGGATLKQLSVTPEQAQFLETRQYDDERIFRIYRCPPALVGMTKEGATSYASSVMQSDVFEKHTIRPLVTKIEAGYGRLLPPGQYLRFNTAALLRADLMTRANAYGAFLDRKVITRDEVRAREDWGPSSDAAGVGTDLGGYLETPNNNAPGPMPASPGA